MKEISSMNMRQNAKPMPTWENQNSETSENLLITL